MITVYVELLLGNDREPRTVHLEDGCTVADLVKQLGSMNEQNYIIIVDGKNRLGDYMLKDGDKVQFFPLMSGG